MDIEGFRRAGYAAVDAVCDYYTNLSKKTVRAQVLPGYLIDQLPREAPKTDEDFALVQSDFESLILPGITNWQHGKFMAYFPGISTFESMIADLYATSVSNPGFNWVCSPACTELEQVMMDWMAKLFGLGKMFHIESGKGGGVILNSASEAVLTAAVAARETALRYLATTEPGSTLSGDGFDIPDDIRAKYSSKLVMYGSTHTHSLGQKAALIFGLTFRAVPVSTADKYALRGDALQEVIDQDIKDGLIPFFVIGTTSTGTVDRIDEIGAVLAEYNTISLHIDAAWAGVALALEDQRGYLRLADINRYATSFCTNMHKWGLVALDCTLFFVRNRKVLNLALDATPAYLRYKEAETGAVIDYRNWQLALGRRFRSIKVWFVMRSYGVKGFQDHLRVGIDHCQQLSKLIIASPSFELVTAPSLALLTFRLGGAAIPADTLPAERNLLNTLLNVRLNARYDVFLTQTLLPSTDEEDVFCIRVALGGRRTTMRDVEEVWAVVVEEGEEVLREWTKTSGAAWA